MLTLELLQHRRAILDNAKNIPKRYITRPAKSQRARQQRRATPTIHPAKQYTALAHPKLYTAKPISAMSLSSVEPLSFDPAYSFETAQSRGHSGAPRQHSFNPYTDNGGTILGITGDDFVVLAGDTRHTAGYNINSRTERKVYRLGEDNNLILATVGFGADSKDVAETMTRAVNDFKFNHNLKNMTVNAAAQYLFTVLYGNRFFPKYTHCILAGLDKDGKGRLYSYDSVGSYSKEGERRAAAGAASSLIVPFLDNQVEFKNQYLPASNGTQERPVEDLPMETVIKLVKDAFTSATERHIEVGDGLQIITVTRDGVFEEMTELKKD